MALGGAWLNDWGIPYSGSQFSDGFARCVHLAGVRLQPLQRGCRERQPDLGAAGGNLFQSGPWHWMLKEFAGGDCFKLKEINHLQHTTGAEHYSAVPRSVWPVFPAFFP